MTRQLRTKLALLLIGLTIFSGCSPTQPFYLNEDGDLSHYIDKATDLEYPDVKTVPLEEVTQARHPFRVSDPEDLEFWDLTLEEAVSISLQNSKILRNLGGVTQINFADSLVGRTAGATSIYDIAIQESSPSGVQGVTNPRGQFTGVDGPGQVITAAQAGGVESALAAFDAQLNVLGTNGSLLGRQFTPQNAVPAAGVVFPSVSSGTSGGVDVSLSKRTAVGTQFTLATSTSYDGTNRFGGSQALPSFWQQTVELQVSQPLLRGAGTLVNRVPIVLARINTDIAAGQFEQSVKNAVLDVENTYWDLLLAYRAVETAKIGRDSAQVTWSTVNEKKLGGIGSAQEEAQAREQYFFFRAALQQALRDLYDTESRLRYLMGLAATDGRLIRPKDEPTSARVEFDWHQVHEEALFRSSEIRQQKWRLKQRELELISAKNLLLPRMNVGMLYRWLGRGHELFGPGNQPFPSISTGPPLNLNIPSFDSSAISELTSGHYQEYNLFLDFEMPVGFRRELASVRNSQLQIARTKAVLEDMELNTSHLISSAVRDLDFRHEQTQSQFNRWKAAHTEVESVIALYEAGKETLDLVLRAQERRANSQIDYYRALCDYNKSLANIHFQKGSILEYNNIFLAEGPWPEKAYYDALGQARERDASYYLDYGWSRPNVVSEGPIPQHFEQLPAGELQNSTSESIPTPAPTPATGETPQEPAPLPGAPLRTAPEIPSQPTPATPEGESEAPSTEGRPAGPITTRPAGPVLNPPRRTALVPRQASFNWSEAEETPVTTSSRRQQ
jgi:outer membrane protein TolC